MQNRAATTGAGGIGAVLLAAVAWVGHNAGWFGHEVEVGLMAARSSIEVRHNLDDIARSSYFEKQAVAVFCVTSSSLAQTGELPNGVTDWRTFVADRAGVGLDSDDFASEKFQELDTAIGLARYNRDAARRYAEACLLGKVR